METTPKSSVCGYGLARKGEMVKAPARAEAAVEQRFAAYPRFFETLGMLDSQPGNWTGSGRIHQKYAGDEDAIEGALDHGDHCIVTENPQSIPNPLLLALGIEAVTPRQMFYEARRDIPTIIGAAMIRHYRRTGYSPDFYEAFLKTSGVEFLIPLFRSMLANS
jgi:hypothetical protein